MAPRTLAALSTLLLLTAGCGDDESGGGGGSGGTTATGGAGGTVTTGGSGTGGSSTTGSGTGGGTSEGFACQYPGDVGIDGHAGVVWAENFEEGSVGAVLARYDDYKNESGMALVADVPSVSTGAASMQLTAGGGTNATDFYKSFGTGGFDDLYVRYYAKYEAGVNYHHTGVWVGGYNPPLSWPNPQAGSKPNGDDRFSVAIEIMTDGTLASPRFDFYNYWMGMKTNPGGDFWGNTLIHDASLVATFDWQCIEIHIRMNPDPTSAAGAELGVWRDDESIVQYDDQGPIGRWLHDKFCRTEADAPSCTDYTIPPPDVVLDLQWRTTTDLTNSYFWPQNYITSGPAGNVWYDDMVLATERIGCICPG